MLDAAFVLNEQTAWAKLRIAFVEARCPEESLFCLLNDADTGNHDVHGMGVGYASARELSYGQRLTSWLCCYERLWKTSGAPQESSRADAVTFFFNLLSWMGKGA